MTDRFKSFLTSLTGPFAWLIKWELDAEGLAFTLVILLMASLALAAAHRNPSDHAARIASLTMLSIWMFLGIGFTLGPD